jgi:hypothetical protein
MSTRKFAVAALVVTSIVGVGLGYVRHNSESNASGHHALETSGSDRPDAANPTTAKSYLSSYIVDRKQQIPFNDTGLNENPAEPPRQLSDYIAISLVNRGTAEYFRFLQTEFHAGATLQANTEAIHQHLLTILPKDDAEKLFALYQKFVDFEFTIGDKAKDWKMPQSPDETLALIGKMQKVQQQHFGEEHADLLFGGELKTLEYTARRAGILNDRAASGTDKEALLKKLAADMFGAEAEKLEEQKNPYNRFEEKLLVYKNELDRLEPPEREKMINALRAKYLPASTISH